jgi:DNA-binding NarL/FixJ family response regulator
VRIYFLTARQLEILDLISKNFTNSEIAKSLGYSESTIRHETMKILSSTWSSWKEKKLWQLQ